MGTGGSGGRVEGFVKKASSEGFEIRMNQKKIQISFKPKRNDRRSAEFLRLRITLEFSVYHCFGPNERDPYKHHNGF